MLTFGEVFAGISGFGLGFTRAGMECRWQIENDEHCNRVLGKHYPNVKRYGDILSVDPRELESVDVCAGGFPCQDLSVAGKRKGLAGERSGLWFEFLRVIECNRPRWVVIENVPGLLSSDEGRDFATIIRGMVNVGYCVAWRVFDAQYFGVAQRRRRVFIVGSFGDGSCAEILFNRESVSWNPPTRREARSGVTPILESGARTNGDGYRDGDGIGVEGDPVFTLQRGKQHAVAATLDQRGRGPTDAVMMNLQVAHALRSEGADASEDGTGRGTPLVVAAHDTGQGWWNQSDIAGTIRAEGENRPSRPSNIVAFSSKDHGADAGELSPTLRAQNFKDSHMNGGGQVAVAFAENQRGEVRTSDVSPQLSCSGGKPGSGYPAVAFTERTRAEGRNFESQEELAYAVTNPGSGGRTHSRQIAGGFGVRRLTPRECERLQSFPDGWTARDAEGKAVSDSARYRMLGNAVCVNVAEWIGKRILECSS